VKIVDFWQNESNKNHKSVFITFDTKLVLYFADQFARKISIFDLLLINSEIAIAVGIISYLSSEDA